ncbi:MAG: GAF domain-containing protein [Pyrinomonadaceae bacterium]
MSGSEDLEQSLRREVEKHIGALLREHQEEILRVQSQLSAQLSRLAERLTGEGTDAGTLASAIAGHLRDARDAGVDEAAQSSAGAGSAGDVALLKAAVDDIDSQRSQADILHALVNRAASFAPRVAFFVVKNERATGWRARGLEGTVGDDSIREISLPLTSDTVLGDVYRTRTTWSGAPGSKADDHEFLSKLGDEPPQRMIAVPLVARDKCVALLYADSAGLEADAINLEALETLVRVTGMAVELLAVKRGAPSSAQAASAAQPAPEHAPSAASAPPPSLIETPAATEAPTAAAPDDDQDKAASMAPVAEAEVSPVVEAEVAAPEDSPEVVATQPASAVAATETAAPSSVTTTEAPAATQAAPTEPAAPYVAPLGTSRRYGQDAELPVEVSDEERRFHNDARRFARLLVSEIKLYNEQKVKEGREQRDLYNRLHEEIDRSRQMYDKRVHPSVSPRYDYFHQELVTTLAEGDAARLGAGYPGASVAV